MNHFYKQDSRENEGNEFLLFTNKISMITRHVACVLSSKEVYHVFHKVSFLMLITS